MEKQKEILQLPATIESINSRVDGSWSIKVGTQELNDEQGKNLIKLNRKLGWFLFKETPFEEPDLLDIPEPETEFKTDKTPSQRLRAVLFRLWEQKYKTKYDTFEECYKILMEKIISWAKNKLE